MTENSVHEDWSHDPHWFEDDEHIAQRNTDYDFPKGWGLFSPEEKHHWFLRGRVFRQAIGQDTAFGRRYEAHKEEEARLDTDQYRYDK